MISVSEKPSKVNIVPIRSADDETLQKLSREGMLSLTLDEMKVIQHYFSGLRRDPTDVELETLAQTWSEHCIHKTFKAKYHYRETKLKDSHPLALAGSRSYENLLKETIVKATKDLNVPWCLSVFEDNAGVISFDDEMAVCFKVETHNHPSALEPYGGAGTGVGGVIRDILGCGLGAKPVLNTDVFCFGLLDTPESQLPTGALPPRRIARGVIAGVRDYGNRMGIPTANGTIYFDAGYTGNPLVFCGTVGLMPLSTIHKTVMPGDLVVAVGGRTGRDGIHGATFSSAPLESGISSSVVQIGHAIIEKKTMDVLLAARNKGLYRSVTDCGAGGFSSAVGELGKSTGVRVWLEEAPLKYPGLAPWEIWVSESQERMVLAVDPQKWGALKALFLQEDVEAVVIGEFTNDKKLVVTHQGETAAEIDMDFLHDGLPKPLLEAHWDIQQHQSRHAGLDEPPTGIEAPLSKSDISATFSALLAHPVIASKESVVRQYDHEVQGGSVIKPFMGEEQDGPTDACVFRPRLTSWKGVAVSNGLNPEMGKWDPYIMAKMAVDEALRNLVAVGGGLTHVAILDNFCWGSSKDPIELAGLVRASEGCREAATAYQIPFISGKDSFNNTWKSDDGKLHSIPPTLLVSAIGILQDVRRCINSGFKEPDNLIYVIGRTGAQMQGSLACRLWKSNDSGLPDVAFPEAKVLYKHLQDAIQKRLIQACHDVSEGGVAIAVAEMAFGGKVGVELDLKDLGLPIHQFLFSETPSRFVVEVPAAFQTMFEQSLQGSVIKLVGKTSKKPSMIIKEGEKEWVNEPIKKLKQQWKAPLSHL